MIEKNKKLNELKTLIQESIGYERREPKNKNNKIVVCHLR
jgi:hypothetical protein